MSKTVAGALCAAALCVSSMSAVAQQQVLSTAGFDGVDDPDPPSAYDGPIGSAAVTQYLPLGIVGLVAVLGAFDDDGEQATEAEAGDDIVARGGLRDRRPPEARPARHDDDADVTTVTATSTR